jgi:hypothetical protein
MLKVTKGNDHAGKIVVYASTIRLKEEYAPDFIIVSI